MSVEARRIGQLSNKAIAMEERFRDEKNKEDTRIDGNKHNNLATNGVTIRPLPPRNNHCGSLSLFYFWLCRTQVRAR